MIAIVDNFAEERFDIRIIDSGCNGGNPVVAISYSKQPGKIRVDMIHNVAIIAVGGKIGKPIHFKSSNFGTGAQQPPS